MFFFLCTAANKAEFPPPEESPPIQWPGFCLSRIFHTPTPTRTVLTVQLFRHTDATLVQLCSLGLHISILLYAVDFFVILYHWCLTVNFMLNLHVVMFYKVTTKPSFKLLSITQILMTYWCLPGGNQVIIDLTPLMDYDDLRPLTCLLTPATARIDSDWEAQLAVELWRKSDNWPWISICDHVSPLPLQSVSLTGWRKWAWCLMIIWLAGNPFVSGVIWLPVEEMTWALEDRKTVSLVLCRTVASFL